MSITRQTEIRRRKRMASRELRRQRDKPPSRLRLKARRAYPVVVAHKGDTPKEPTARQIRLAEWFAGAVADKEAIGWSRTKIAEECGLSRKDFYRWMDPADIPKSPRSATIERICKGLRIPYAVPARIMGWTANETPSEIDLKRDRAETIMRNLEARGRLTPERRVKYETMLQSIDRAYERGLDAVIEEYERDFSGDEDPRR